MFNIPENKLPDCLKDEQRINVLFAPLRSRSANSRDWESKISSWKTIIKAYCEANDVYSFTLSSLNEVFVRNGRPPTCLEEVIDDMSKKGEVQVMEEFLRAKNASSWSGWAVDVLVKKPFSWSYNKIKNSVFVFKNTDSKYIHLETIKLKGEELISSLSNKYKNKLISLKELSTELDKDSNQVENVKLLLHHLRNERKVDITKLDEKDNEIDSFLIKVGDGNIIKPISEVDIGIYTLEKNEHMLSKTIETMEDEIHFLVKEAKMHLSKNHKQMAKGTLRKKHDLEKRIDKKMNALRNIQMLLEKIRDTHSDAHVWEAYKNALTAFNTTYNDTGLSEDRIENTMLHLGDMLDQQEDIQSALARPAVDVEDIDLEEELAELMKQDAQNPPPDDGGVNTSDLERELEQIKLNLPDVPDDSPNKSSGTGIILN